MLMMVVWHSATIIWRRALPWAIRFPTQATLVANNVYSSKNNAKSMYCITKRRKKIQHATRHIQLTLKCTQEPKWPQQCLYDLIVLSYTTLKLAAMLGGGLIPCNFRKCLKLRQFVGIFLTNWRSGTHEDQDLTGTHMAQGFANILTYSCFFITTGRRVRNAKELANSCHSFFCRKDRLSVKVRMAKERESTRKRNKPTEHWQWKTLAHYLCNSESCEHIFTSVTSRLGLCEMNCREIRRKAMWIADKSVAVAIF